MYVFVCCNYCVIVTSLSDILQNLNLIRWKIYYPNVGILSQAYKCTVYVALFWRWFYLVVWRIT